ncbi:MULTISPECIES: hypothetical protein [Escherichia]|uniref:hypothetical protein n=1 Tax=Escherichia coli TaxID=562 RepID=UPI000B7F0452|nr:MULTISPECIES: hypothetical protein [Escherichia]EJK1448685.1 hypothetical protein [Escherichia coli]ELS7814087.1 hypothetical protein [Escherichia coli]ELT9957054.1 hypothetical protein [Escherichia coli]MCA7617723.1 hypothetical protein [Escherichia coli]MDZ8151497.1 hypothetical protein [Escherichia coli]
MLIDLIRDSVALRHDDNIELYNESDGSTLNKKIIQSFIDKEDKDELPVIQYYLNFDDSGFSPSLTMSIVNRPVVNNMMELVKIVNDTSIKFNKTNVKFQIIDKKPIIVTTTSFFFFDDIESLLFKDYFGYSKYDGKNDDSKKASIRLSSILGSMIIALLEASMFIDESSIKMIDKQNAEEKGHVKN